MGRCRNRFTPDLTVAAEIDRLVADRFPAAAER
jgi:hypothetical protein